MDATSIEMLFDSKLVGAAIRGLTKSDIERPKDGFKCINCLGREYLTIPHNVKCVEFDISRYGQFTKSLTFDSPVSEKTAIEAVETYLSEPLTEDYFEMIKDDMFHNNLSWEQAKEDYKCRGDCLTDARFLEEVSIKNGIMSFFIGS